ncbi:MAG: DUF255 domain-containing protein [Myxococcota bacterium]
MANRLTHETSPYLLQHAHNPVDWYPWGDEALEAARARNVPILLSIGYSSCHWCHVMERESFENAVIAARMNSLFVNVKVDREERPDLDELYMRAVQAFNRGHGGWPMTVFLTPEGVPFFGGTYFPPTTRNGTPGLVDVLSHVSDLWRKNPDEIERITGQVRQLLDQGAAAAPAAKWLAQDWLAPVVAAASRDFDPIEGGFGEAPKFPPHGLLEALLAHHRRTTDPHSLEMAVRTLDAMAKGGMYDVVGGGFCRYSVDEEWRVPHFEKMLYDNAQLIPLYVAAHQVTGAPHHARVVRDTVGFVLREMSVPGGAFASSFDADSGGATGGEGAYYVFDRDELVAALGHSDGVRAAELLQVTAGGTFEHGKSVLRLEVPLESLDPRDRAFLTDVALPALARVRAKRDPPARDDKVVLGWNALTISALARAGAAFNELGWVSAAVGAAGFLVEHLRVDGRWHRVHRLGRATVPAFADDYADLMVAFVDLYEATLDRRWLASALEVADAAIDLFWDHGEGALWTVGRDRPALVARARPGLGSAEPGANGTMALGFVRLGRLCGRDDLLERADRLLRSAQGLLSRAARALGPEAIAGTWLAEGGTEVAIAGDPTDELTARLWAVVRARWLPFTVIARADGDPTPGVVMAWLDGKTAAGGRGAAYVCEGHTCQLPTSDPDALARQLDERMTRAGATASARTVRVRAPELPQDPEAWLGSAPLSIAGLAGRVVVLDFWTYCCVNCMHVLPELAAIEERYHGQPVVVIGVHCAKFPAEQVLDNVRAAITRHDVRHPVVCDPDHAVWDEYAVRSWPTLAVVDATGRIAFHQSGEIDRDSLAQVIDGLLAEARAAGTLAEPLAPAATPEPPSSELWFPGKVHVWPDALDQELDTDPYTSGGRVYVSDTGHHRIVECELGLGPDGWPTLTRLRTFGSGEAGRADGPSGQASFRHPQGVRRFGTTLYVADTDNHLLRAVDLTDGTVRTLAGTGRKATVAPPRSALAEPLTVDLRSPWDVEVVASRHAPLVFLAMAGSHQVWVYGPTVGHLGILAGSGREDHVDGPAATAALAQPSSLSLLGRYLLFADAETSSVRAVDLQSHHVVTVVGRGLFDFGDVDGSSDVARLQHPLAVTFGDDTVYVADTFNGKIKAIGLASGDTHTVSDGGAEPFGEPGGIARAGEFLLVADTNRHQLRAVRRSTGESRVLPMGPRS